MAFSPDATAKGYLSLWEVAKAYAFQKVLTRIEEGFRTPAHELLRESRDQWIAKELRLQGGGSPSGRDVRKTVKRCARPDSQTGIQGKSLAVREAGHQLIRKLGRPELRKLQWR